MDIPEIQNIYLNHKDEFFSKLSEYASKKQEEPKEMTQGIDLQSLVMPRGADSGFGLGGGLIGGVLLGALLGRNNGLFGGNGDGVSGLNNLQGAIDTNAILSNLGDIKAAVPLAEAQVQLALAGAQSDITSQTLQQTIGLTSQIDNVKSENMAATNALALQNANSFSFLKSAVDSIGTDIATGIGSINSNIDKSAWSLSREISNDGEKTRALIGQIDRENLNRIITTQASELVELRNEGARERDRHGIEITMTNNQNQNQLQLQQQAQAISSLVGVLGDAIQSIRATNSAINVGGTLTANPTNTNTNIR